MDLDVPDHEYALQRAVALSDGVFAVAITLSVFQLVPSDLSVKLHTLGTLAVLESMKSELLNAIVSFIVVAIYWGGHQRIFANIKGATRGLLSLNLCFLGAITFLPFSTQLLNTNAQSRASVIPYALNISVAGYLLALLWRFVVRNPAIARRHISPGEVRYGMLRAIVAPTFFLGSIAIALFNAPLAKLSWIGVFVGMRIVNRLARPRSA